MIDKIKNLIYQTEGKYTEELVLKKSRFGLGKFPERLLPDGLTKVVCGYCSTGCSLDVHIKNGKPVNITPSHEYPVNLGEACPKGWEALTPLWAKDRATKPLLRNARGVLKEVEWIILQNHLERKKLGQG